MSAWRKLIPPLWLTYTMWMLLLVGIVVGVIACGDDDAPSVEIDNATWTVTTDPYGREWACLTVAPSVGIAMFCAPAPAP